MVATLAAVVVTTILERSTGEEDASLALAARSSVAAGAELDDRLHHQPAGGLYGSAGMQPGHPEARA